MSRARHSSRSSYNDVGVPPITLQKKLINYIVARAEDDVHPESILLERFDEDTKERKGHTEDL